MCAHAVESYPQLGLGLWLHPTSVQQLSWSTDVLRAALVCTEEFDGDLPER